MLSKLAEASQNEENQLGLDFIYLFIMIWININLQHAAHVIHWEGTARHKQQHEPHNLGKEPSNLLTILLDFGSSFKLLALKKKK